MKTKSILRSLVLSAAVVALVAGMAALPAAADILHLDDVIITFSLCVGNDCVNGENFGFDTIRLKENNLRIHFDDTSSAASFPRNDWRIIANDSTNGGASYLAIEDSTAGRQVFKVEAGADSNALYVDTGGRVGFSTSSPVTELHVVDGDTPVLRLEQDGSSGFTPQTWDVAGNETNFFIRDATGGSLLPFRIRPTAPSNSIFVDTDGDIGMNTSNPGANLHVRGRSGENAELELESAGGTSPGSWEIKRNSSTGRLTFFATGGGATTASFKFDPQAQENLLRVGILAADTVDIVGNLVITGDCTEQNGACADYVFEPGYELRSLEDLEAFISENKHLPNVPSADQMRENGVNMTHLSGRLLEKIEELTLYTLQQQKTIEQLQGELADLKSAVE